MPVMPYKNVGMGKQHYTKVQGMLQQGAKLQVVRSHTDRADASQRPSGRDEYHTRAMHSPGVLRNDAAFFPFGRVDIGGACT